jgi:dTDP-4-amino-4,6-dideoxygalactose transaminase
MALADKYDLYVIEDAAQAVMSTYNGKPLGSIGHLGAFSFHDTKNYTSGGEGGLLIINDEQFVKRAEIIREKGTNRSQFFRGMVDKYSWVDIGSSFLPSEIQAAYLYGQLEKADEINNNRLESWEYYYQSLEELFARGSITLPVLPRECIHNAHMFYIKVKDIDERALLLEHLKTNGITAVFHYIPLHSSIAGEKFSAFIGEEQYTTSESEKLVRLPLYYGLSRKKQNQIITALFRFFS